jgi:hypothetical protein
MHGLAVRWVATPFFPRSSSMPGGADGRGVDIPLRPVDQAASIGLHTQTAENLFPGALASPVQMSPMHRFE